MLELREVVSDSKPQATQLVFPFVHDLNDIKPFENADTKEYIKQRVHEFNVEQKFKSKSK